MRERNLDGWPKTLGREFNQINDLLKKKVKEGKNFRNSYVIRF